MSDYEQYQASLRAATEAVKPYVEEYIHDKHRLNGGQQIPKDILREEMSFITLASPHEREHMSGTSRFAQERMAAVLDDHGIKQIDRDQVLRDAVFDMLSKQLDGTPTSAVGGHGETHLHGGEYRGR